MDDAIKEDIVERLTELVIDAAPDAVLRSMYGGTMIELEDGNPKSRVGGFFVYASHVSFEFSKGVTFEDPAGVLEGSGKFRRHVKLHRPEDVDDKGCAGFLQQALVT